MVHRLEGHTSRQTFLPPWTVSRKVWSDALSAQHSGISTDVLLFSDIHLSLVHDYRVHKPGLLHIAFRKNCLSQLCARLPLPVGLPSARVASPDSSGSGLLCLDDSLEVLRGPTRTTRLCSSAEKTSARGGASCCDRSSLHDSGSVGCGGGSGA